MVTLGNPGPDTDNTVASVVATTLRRNARRSSAGAHAPAWSTQVVNVMPSATWRPVLNVGPPARLRLMAEPRLFPGLGIGGYRCFGDLQLIAPLGRITLLVGPNNVGKSTALRLFSQLGSLGKAAQPGGTMPELLTADDVRSVRGEAQVPFEIAWPLRPLTVGPGVDDRYLATLRQALQLGRSDHAWVRLTANGESLHPTAEWLDALQNLRNVPWADLSRALTSTTGGAPGADLERTMSSLRSKLTSPAPKTLVVPAHREIRSGESGGWQFSGEGIIEQLDRIRNPDSLHGQDRDHHEQFLSVVTDVLELSSFDYHVSRAANQTLFLHIDEERRPLGSIGTGIEHSILLIAATIVEPSAMLCVEEPEVHMHPRLQRRLAQYLRDNTSNQIILSTHSATLIDSLRGQTFELSMEANATRVRGPITGGDLQTLDNLGYRASDLLQTNFAIWVEGPSDRIYLLHWLRSQAPDLREGIEFSVVQYGGSLLAHLSAIDEVLDTTVDATLTRLSLPRINQHLAILCDSDKSSSKAPLKPRVERVIHEVEQGDYATVWVTAGRTIENYLPAEMLRRLVPEVHPSVNESSVRSGQWVDLVSKIDRNQKTTLDVDKIKLAIAVANEPADFSMLDLHDRITDLIAAIRGANS